MDFILRSAHEIAAGDADRGRYTHTAKQIAYDVNSTTQVDPILDIAKAGLQAERIDWKHNLGRRKPIV